MATARTKLPTRTYELRDDPLKKVLSFAVCALGIWIMWNSAELGLRLGAAFFGLGALAMLVRPSHSVRATPQGLWLRRAWGLLYVPWSAVAEVGVHEVVMNHTSQCYLLVRLKEGSAHLTRQSWPCRLASTVGWPATGGITVATVGTEPAEVVDALNDLYEEYVREGVLQIPSPQRGEGRARREASGG